ncbi:TetR/AcrR family transcriptional regulator [Bacillus sp. CMF21]|uniref:TetR/AcrR family transcriptional regulator n=1 Tax=Metabacillus dongyingensis TaxID=2874282 RepID=UPI001CBE8278|nr:TetR/AcrR family transcriptional regulator [Metabacillus dongyingensis]UAL53460.1 TetR/AcrR family transcriptional regulator [Metabacillus dongyingensis]UOK58951.1 TetR/AcrR family transcriptional regulator [Bacillus sp. OVS6]USK29784.1 TetR/AcrR family transcriptional regulator [Bacillus sp. CMF21]
MAAGSVEGTKERILDAAYKLFAEHGYEHTPISLIMKTVGRSKGTFYSHYQRKEDIALDIIDKQVYRNYGFIEKVVEPYIYQKDYHVLDFFTGYFTIGLHLEDRKEWTLVFNDLIRLSIKDEVIREKLSLVHNGWIYLFNRAISRGIELKQLSEDIDREAIIKVILSLYKGIQLERTYGNGPDIEQIRYILERILRQ